MGGQAINAPRTNTFQLEPEILVLVTDKEHPLYDPRVEDAPSESMIANVAMYGVLEPILVRKNGIAIEVIAGRSRVKAAIEANRRLVAEGKPPIRVPAYIKGGTDADLFGVLISENELRREDSMIAKGEKARKLLNMGYTVQQIAVTFGATRQAVDNWLAADELPTPIKSAVEAGEMSATAALQMADLPREEQMRRFEEIKNQGVKPTIQTMRNAAKPDTSLPQMKTRREIEIQIKKYAAGDTDCEYAKGYREALYWVMGKNL